MKITLTWKPCPPEFPCPKCDAPIERTMSPLERRIVSSVTGPLRFEGIELSPFGGSVRCTKCDYRDSVTGYLGRSMVQVEPLPEGAVSVYIRELTQVQADEDAKVHAALDALAANVGAASIREAEDARILEAMKEGKK